MATMKRRYIIFPLLLMLVLSSCRFKPKDGLEFEQNLVAPLLKSRVSLEDALTDTTVIVVNPDNSLKVVFRDTLADLLLSDYLVIPDTAVKNKITLDSLSLATDTLEQDITMADIARQLIAQGPPQDILGNAILNGHGSTLFLPVSETGLDSADELIDASDFFDEADLISGKIVIELENRLPFNLTNVIFALRNDGMLSDTLAKITMPSVPAFQTRSDSADLSGQTVESQLVGKLVNIDITNSTLPWPIDTTDYLRLRLIVKDLGASRATAVFPAQRVIGDTSRVKYDFGEDEIAITRFQVESGTLRIRAFSTIQDTIEFTYLLPTAVKDGEPVMVMERLIPDTVADTAGANIAFDLAGYYIDLTVNGDSVNLFPYILNGDLLYSGVKQTMDLSDSIDVFYGLIDIKPSYIEGYLGKQDFSFIDSVNLDFFNGILGGTLDLTNPKVDLTIMNSIGVDGEMKINMLRAYNSRTTQVLDLAGSIMTSPIEVLGPRLPNVGQVVTSKIQLNAVNSNIAEVISLLPDRLEFDMLVEVNKNGNPALRDNFATDESRISAFLDMEVPLEGIADNLTLQDTVPVAISEATLPEGVTNGTLNLVVSNYFPFEAGVQIFFRNVGGMAFDSLFANGPALVPAGAIDQDGYVQAPGQATLSTLVDQARLDDLRDRASDAIIRFSMSTKPSGTPVKIYTTYGIDFHLVGDFRFSVDL